MLSLVDICKSQGRGKRRVQILRDVSLSVASREIVGILGSRDEKGTTLLEVAAGFDAARYRTDATRRDRRHATVKCEARIPPTSAHPIA